jgi:uncharacterized protein YkwD
MSGRCPAGIAAALVSVLALSVAEASAATARACAEPTPPGSEHRPALAERVVSVVNEARVEDGLAPLRVVPALVRAARLKAMRMAATGRAAHEDVVAGRLVGFAERITACGYAWRRAGENLGWGFDAPRGALAGWLGSPPHRANVLEPTFTETGTAVVWDGSRLLFVQEFGRPVRA